MGRKLKWVMRVKYQNIRDGMKGQEDVPIRQNMVDMSDTFLGRIARGVAFERFCNPGTDSDVSWAIYHVDNMQEVPYNCSDNYEREDNEE